MPLSLLLPGTEARRQRWKISPRAPFVPVGRVNRAGEHPCTTAVQRIKRGEDLRRKPAPTRTRTWHGQPDARHPGEGVPLDLVKPRGNANPGRVIQTTCPVLRRTEDSRRHRMRRTPDVVDSWLFTGRAVRWAVRGREGAVPAAGSSMGFLAVRGAGRRKVERRSVEPSRRSTQMGRALCGWESPVGSRCSRFRRIHARSPQPATDDGADVDATGQAARAGRGQAFQVRGRKSAARPTIACSRKSPGLPTSFLHARTR